MNLTEIRTVLSEQEIQLTKSLGQNFMHDQNQIRRIVAAADLGKEDSVVEIGPGLGPLTEHLLEAAGKVVAIETDRRLINFLEGRFKDADHFELVHADALQLICKEERDWSQWKMVANMPYSVASPILVELAKKRTGPKWITTTLQLEVGQRLVAKPHTKAYGILTLLLKLSYEPRLDFTIPRGCFFPEPRIDSACVSLCRRPEPLLALERERIFERIVKRGFSQRRKMMLKLLKQDWDPDKLEQAYGAADLDVKVRAEAVSLEQYIVMTNILAE
ncbi:MAG: 16S rRNA (adenine1518-N6/adenine1519-N6)-dimethyltransferase [Limisphaerales bacterium]|jgi:16S rRNA (adenine1518-N6/adenine1519-N6)-dimethyltransferase